MDDILLDRVRNRLVSYVDGGSRDHSIVLSADADRDARSLWDQAHVAAADGECSLAVLEALGWLHWIRYEAQPSGKDRDDLQAATVFFSKVHRVTPNRTPPQLRDFLVAGNPAVMEDTLGTQAQSESSYVAKQYPGAFNKEMELGLQLRNVPIPSEAKPDINGFREGDRVCLTRPFSGDGQHYAVGVTGTIFLPDTSPAHIRVGRMANLLYVLLDSGNPVQMSGDALQKIPGRFEVIYSDDRESVSVVPH